MRLTGLLAATALVSMIAAPAFAASANPAAKLSLVNSSASAGSPAKPAGGTANSGFLSGMAVTPGMAVAAAAAVAAVVVAAVAASHSDSKAASS